MGQNFGFSNEHSSLEANVRNLSTGYISPHFNLVFDNFFEMVIHTRDYASVFNAICNDLFELNRGQYYTYKYDDNGNLIYRTPPLEDVCINKQGCCGRGHELKNQRRYREDSISEKNRAVTDIITLNTKDNGTRPHKGAPVSDEESSVDYLLGHTTTKSQGDFVSDDADDGPPNYQYPDDADDGPPNYLSLASNIPSPPQNSSTNTSQEGDISRQGAQSNPKHKYQQKNFLKQFGNQASMRK